MDQQGEILAALKVWREGLVGLTRRSALVKFRAPKSSLRIDAPTPDEVLSRLQAGASQPFRGDVDPDHPDAAKPLPDDFLHSPRPHSEVGAAVRNLKRRASEEFLDRGIKVLYLAFGMLDWRDVNGDEMVSPLLLVPVELISDGPKAIPVIEAGEDDPVLNPALALRLRDFGIDLPTAEDIDGLSVSQVLAAVRDALETNEDFAGWAIRETVYLSTFSFVKEAMFRDLRDNEAKILEHPIVRALSTSDPSHQSSLFEFYPIDPANIDKLAPPEATPLVLDADSSQRTAIAAAVAGKSFVMDGPPGTGKSQTIANMIGALLHTGKTVLFVSEKMAALDVVRNRLAEAGLGSYLLELHSNKASRKEVAAELLKTLDNVAKPPAGMSTLSRQSVKERQEQLNNYASAINEVRKPLNMTLHSVLGLCAKLRTAPMAPLPEVDPMTLTEAEYFEIQDTLPRLARAWRPAEQGRSFLWRDITDDRPLDAPLYHARLALEELRDTVQLNADLVAAFGLTQPSDTPQLLAIIEHQHRSRPAGVMDQWLTSESTQPLISVRDNLRRHIVHLKAAEESVIHAAGVPWTSLPESAALPPSPPPVTVAPFPLEIRTMPASQLTSTADRFESQARMLRERLGALTSLATSLGLAPVSTFADVDRLARLIGLRSRNTRPDRRWFTRSGLADVRAAATALRKHVAELNDAEAKASAVFTPEALKAPLAELQDRFTNLHKGLKKLSGNYRADKKTVAGLLTDAADVKNGIKHLSEAVAWAEISKAFDSLVVTHGDLLGPHWAGRTTNFEALNAAFNVVDEVLTITDNNAAPQLVTYLTGSDSNDAYQTVIDTARADFDGWKMSLQPAPALTGRPELLLESVDHAIGWLTAHVGPLRSAATRVSAIGAVTGGNHSLVDADNLLTLAGNARQATEEFRAAESGYRAMLGGHFTFGDTDLAALDEAIGWATRLRFLSNGPLTAGQVKTLAGSNFVERMGPAYSTWTDRRDRVLEAFAVGRRAELTTELDDYRDAIDLIDAFREDTVGQQEWFEYQRAYSDLAKRGLDLAVDFCIEQRVKEREVGNVINRALLRGWCDAVIQSDNRLRPLLAADREALVAEYRHLDRELIKGATADIIRAANSRRPANVTMGEPGVIRREGSKQKKHMPVRDLMSRTRNVTPNIKPVFMMSPLAVSQYLPADMEFDVVIFDEASQVTPGDAVNCIYRGRALILAGDDKQLPPTSFFERHTDDDDEDDSDVKDFQSVLELAKASGAFNNLGLRWHYRSRHEDLIAFSNYKFYKPHFITFPSAHTEGDDVGVEFFHAHGVYRRGGGAINPVEAAMVAERVTDHFTKRPDLTLGVVTFSVAQADAVQYAIDEALKSRPDLERFFDTNDRLGGFFIRALEQVQGDERDVIIFSVGYGPDEAGKISTSFGALNKDKGWRRLNVAITRARQRVEVVASMYARDIPASQNENVNYFRDYLDYAEKGPQTLAVPYSSTGLDPESPFEESVIAAIRGWGYTVEPQVGAAGFRIDIGVRHPAHAGMFAIGVECDGYQYHSAPAARDRDRLRDEILTGLGWRLHRIWGTAWYRDRSTEESRLRAAIDAAIAAPLNDRTKKVSAIERPVVESEQAEFAVVPTWTTTYRLAPAWQLPRWVDPGESGNHLHMVSGIRALVEHEGPIHIDVAYERLRDWWKIGRIGSNIRDNINRAVQQAQVIRDGDFLLASTTDVAQVRTPSEHVTRKFDQVHLDELGVAAILTIGDVGAVSRSEVVQCVARIFGWTRTRAAADQRINEAIDRIVADGKALLSSDGTLTLPTSGLAMN